MIRPLFSLRTSAPSAVCRNGARDFWRSPLRSLLVIVAVTSQTAVAQQPATFQHGVVAADHPAASAAGAEILRKGGNVVDAAVATSFALSVVRPASCGIGGGGFMVIWDAKKQKAVALDYRERAPAAASRNMFDDGAATDTTEAASVRGGKAVAIPGDVAGLCFAAKEYGTLPLATLLEPAIQLAKKGVPVDQHDLGVQSSSLKKFDIYDGYDTKFAALKKLYLNNGKRWKTGDVFDSPLETVLEKIAANGPSAFYEGDVAKAIVKVVTDHGGIITAEDLAATKPVVREAPQGKFHSSNVYSMPPASSGGVALLQTMQSLEAWEQLNGRSLKSLQHNSADYVHVVAEAMKHAFADRAEFLGDTDFVNVPVRRMLAPGYAKQIAQRIDVAKTQPAESYGRFFAAADAGTSHFSVIDAAGNAVACTETINLTFGSFVVEPLYGIILNNQIDDFAARPGEPNAFGLMQSEANAIEPGKKPLSSMTPTIVVRDGKAVFASGASGGPRIITATIQATLNHLVFGMDPMAAASAPRFHHQWFPNTLLLESTIFTKLGDALKAKGHEISENSSLAANQSASLSKDGLKGGSDPRKHGVPAGF